MRIFITHASAFEWWSHYSDPFTSGRPPLSRVDTSVSIIPPKRELDTLAGTLGLQAPLWLSVESKDQRSGTTKSQCRVWRGPQECRSYISISNGIYVSTPEACFLQLAKMLPLVHLVKVGFELCGTYAEDDSDTGFHSRPAVLSPRQLSRYLELAESSQCYGYRYAQRAAKHVLAGSASPAETNLAMLLSLPASVGGYGIKPPLLNAEISLKQRDSIWDRTVKPDLFWPDASLAVEYESHAHHSSAMELSHDSQRRNALEEAGVRVITVTKDQLYKTYEFDQVARQINKALGRYTITARSDHAIRRNTLRKQILHTDLRQALGIDSCKRF